MGTDTKQHRQTSVTDVEAVSLHGYRYPPTSVNIGKHRLPMFGSSLTSVPTLANICKHPLPILRLSSQMDAHTWARYRSPSLVTSAPKVRDGKRSFHSGRGVQGSDQHRSTPVTDVQKGGGPASVPTSVAAQPTSVTDVV